MFIFVNAYKTKIFVAAFDSHKATTLFEELWLNIFSHSTQHKFLSKNLILSFKHMQKMRILPNITNCYKNLRVWGKQKYLEKLHVESFTDKNEILQVSVKRNLLKFRVEKLRLIS